MRPNNRSIYLVFPIVLSFNASAAMTVKYQHTDVLGSLIAETDNNGNIIQKNHYQAYGEQIGGQKAGIGYTGHLEDTDLGLTYMQQRYYDPEIGRFYSNDPVGFSASNPMMFNRYAYANNNPYKYTDPDGRKVEVVARPLKLPAFGGLGAHTYTRVTASDGTQTVFSSHKVDGKNVVSKNHPTDTSPHFDSGSIYVGPPEGMTQDQFDSAVIAQGEKMVAGESLKYEAFPSSDKPAEGNCHTTTRNLINGAGGKISENFDPKGMNPDLHGDRKTNGN